MIYRRILIQRIVSPDAKNIAEARSEAITSSDSETTIRQAVMVKISSGNHSSSSSSSITFNVH